jgi:hypothetical protein
MIDIQKVLASIVAWFLGLLGLRCGYIVRGRHVVFRRIVTAGQWDYNVPMFKRGWIEKTGKYPEGIKSPHH